MPESPAVSLPALGRRLSAHPDLLERLCVAEEIAYYRRDNVRWIEEHLVPELAESLELWRHRPRPWGRAASAARLRG